MARRDLTGAVDFAVLLRMTGEDNDAVVDEILGVFQNQARTWTPLLDAQTPGWRDAAHTLGGAGAGIGAGALAAACKAAELGDEAGAQGRLDKVRDALDQALADVAAYRHELALKGLKTR